MPASGVGSALWEGAALALGEGLSAGVWLHAAREKTIEAARASEVIFDIFFIVSFLSVRNLCTIIEGTVS